MCFDTDLYGQRRGKKKKKKPSKTTKTDEYFDESGGFVQKLWYGASGTLNFNGGNGYFITNIGLSPMVGYKITDNFSVGPRLGLNYTLLKVQVSSNPDVVKRARPATYSVGAFSRYKVFQRIFAHVEYEFRSDGRPWDDFGNINFDNNDEIVIYREFRENFHLGAGYNSGGVLSYEIYALYNVLVPDNSLDNPFSIRAGFTYKF